MVVQGVESGGVRGSVLGYRGLSLGVQRVESCGIEG